MNQRLVWPITLLSICVVIGITWMVEKTQNHFYLFGYAILPLLFLFIFNCPHQWEEVFDKGSGKVLSWVCVKCKKQKCNHEWEIIEQKDVTGEKMCQHVYHLVVVKRCKICNQIHREDHSES